MTNEDFAAECHQRRVDYDTLFQPRVTPAWLLKFEEQVLDECRKELAVLDLPTQAEFEQRVAIMNAEREQSQGGPEDEAPRSRVLAERSYRARKSHECDGCHGRCSAQYIRPGDIYTVFCVIDDGEFKVLKLCQGGVSCPSPCVS